MARSKLHRRSSRGVQYPSNTPLAPAVNSEHATTSGSLDVSSQAATHSPAAIAAPALYARPIPISRAIRSSRLRTACKAWTLAVTVCIAMLPPNRSMAAASRSLRIAITSSRRRRRCITSLREGPGKRSTAGSADRARKGTQKELRLWIVAPRCQGRRSRNAPRKLTLASI